MDEDGRAAALELGKDGLERRVARVDAVVVGEHAHPVGVQDVERVRHLGQRALDIRQRQRRPEAEAVRPAPLQVGAELVALARELARLRVVAVDQVAPGRADAQDRLGNVRLVHELEICFLGPHLCSTVHAVSLALGERKYRDGGGGKGRGIGITGGGGFLPACFTAASQTGGTTCVCTSIRSRGIFAGRASAKG